MQIWRNRVAVITVGEFLKYVHIQVEIKEAPLKELWTDWPDKCGCAKIIFERNWDSNSGTKAMEGITLIMGNSLNKNSLTLK